MSRFEGSVDAVDVDFQAEWKGKANIHLIGLEVALASTALVEPKR